MNFESPGDGADGFDLADQLAGDGLKIGGAGAKEVFLRLFFD